MTSKGRLAPGTVPPPPPQGAHHPQIEVVAGLICEGKHALLATQLRNELASALISAELDIRLEALPRTVGLATRPRCAQRTGIDNSEGITCLRVIFWYTRRGRASMSDNPVTYPSRHVSSSVVRSVVNGIKERPPLCDRY